jgi:hypothetical protein
LKSFEQVPVPAVAEKPYGSNSRTWGWLCEGRNLLVFVARVTQVRDFGECDRALVPVARWRYGAGKWAEDPNP